jgi:hypothetical protein
MILHHWLTIKNAGSKEAFRKVDFGYPGLPLLL